MLVHRCRQSYGSNCIVMVEDKQAHARPGGKLRTMQDVDLLALSSAMRVLESTAGKLHSESHHS